MSDEAPIDENKLIAERRQKLAALRAQGQAFPNDFKRDAHAGDLAASFGDKEEGVLLHSFDLAEIERYRAEWGFFRDRRTDLYAKSIV